MNSNLHYTSPKLSVKDSFDDDEVSDDVEDEVFIRDGKNGFKLDEEIGVKRPLMAPRRKFKYNQLNPERCKRPLYKRICTSYSYGVSFLSIFLGISTAAIIILCVVPNPFDRFQHWKMEQIPYPTIVPCTHFKTEHIWHQSFPFLKTEAALETFDANGDSVLDIVIGFSTGVKENEMPDKCSLYEESNGMCGGGLLALDGKSGQLLWRFWTRKDVLFIECSQNVNEDSTNDCLVSGKGGVLCVLDGKTGSLIWRFDKSTIEHRIDLYSAQYIFDLNDDGSAEVLISHTSDKSSHLVILNGRNGKEIGQIESPDKKSIFTVPRVLHTRNNTYNVVFSTGSLESPGALYSIPLESIALSDVGKCVKIWSAPTGVGSGILLVDVNNDQSLDIVFTSGHTVTALSGSDNSQLWNVTSVEANPAQILVGPTPAYFDDDPIPDLLVTEMIGPSFPTYYYSKTWVASGSLGKSLLNYDIIRSGSVNAPGISLSFSGTGNDMFLYWITTCSVPDSLQQQPFYFSQDTTLHEKTHAELCKLRFNKTEESRLYILSQHIEPPGILIYSSKNQWDIEHNNSDNTFSYPKSDERNKYNSNFRHKGQPFYQIPSEPSQKKSSYGNYPQYGDRETQRSRWQSPQVSYDDRLPLLSNMNLGDLADAYYSQEGGSPDLGGTVDDGRDERANYRKEMKREAPAQSAFLPRATSTATLVNGVNGTGVEVVFATFWEAAAINVRIFNENQQKCIQQKLAIERSSNNLNSLELEMVEESAERECIGGRSEDWGAETDSPPTGQLTVFRLRLEPSCSELRAGEECSRLLPFTEQSYPRRGSDVVFKARPQPLHQFLTA